MDKQHLETLDLPDLKAELIKYGLSPQRTKAQSIRVLMAHFQDNVPQNPHNLENIEEPLPSGVSPSIISEDSHTPCIRTPAINGAPSVSLDPNLRLMLDFMQSQMNRQQEMFNQMMSFNIQSTRNPDRIQTGHDSPSRSSTLASPAIGQAIKTLTSQIPFFGGTEIAERWIQKVERLSHIYQATEDVMSLAATSKLNKLAREWFDLDTDDINDSWATFKATLSSRFRSRVSALEIMDKVEARK